MLKSSDFVRGYTEEFKQKCEISVIPIAFANVIRICSSIAQPFFYQQYQINKLIIWKNKEEQNKNEMKIYNYTRLYYPNDSQPYNQLRRITLYPDQHTIKMTVKNEMNEKILINKIFLMSDIISWLLLHNAALYYLGRMYVTPLVLYLFTTEM